MRDEELENNSTLKTDGMIATCKKIPYYPE